MTNTIITAGEELMHPAETRNFAVSFVGLLDAGELLTGTPTVAEETSTDLTIANVAVNTAALTINGATVAIGQAVQFSVTGGLAAGGPLADGQYRINVQCGTDSTPAQTLVVELELRVAAN